MNSPAQVFLALALAGSVQRSTGPAALDQDTLQCPGKSRALVVSGGGVRGAYQVGALWYLTHVLGCDFDQFVGTSTGALSAALLSQAKDKEDLKRRVDVLVSIYTALDRRSNLVDRRFLGKVRLLLPRWLGGVDGLGTLAPLERILRSHLQREPLDLYRLTIPVVSLQSGALMPDVHKPYDPVDLVMGSASIPVAVDPRRARFWVLGTVEAFVGDVVTLSVAAIPGLADPNCQLRISGLGLEGYRVLPCKQLESEPPRVADQPRSHYRNMDLLGFAQDEIAVSTKIRLRLQTLTERDNAMITRAITLSRLRQIELEFSTYHQLVDGGVTDNAPIRRAVRMLDRKGIDTIIVLLSGRARPSGSGPQEVHGGLGIGKVAMDLMWDSYQSAAISLPMERVFLRKTVCAWGDEQDRMHEWLQELRQIEDDTNRASIESLIRSFPRTRGNFDSLLPYLKGGCSGGDWERWQVLVVDPPAPSAGDPLDVNQGQIRKALREGCMRAATVFVDASERGTALLAPDASAYGGRACRPLEFAGH